MVIFVACSAYAVHTFILIVNGGLFPYEIVFVKKTPHPMKMTFPPIEQVIKTYKEYMWL